jgi:hypothetical protein
MLGFIRLHIDEVKTVERRRYFQRAGRASLDLLARALDDVDTRAAEAVYVVLLEPSAEIVEGFGISRAILLDDVELEDRPRSDFIEADSGVGHAARRQPTIR